MRYLFMVLVFVVLLTGCARDWPGADLPTNPEFITEQDGIRVYSFRQHGRRIYFTTHGETAWTRSYGRTSYDERVAHAD